MPHPREDVLPDLTYMRVEIVQALRDARRASSTALAA